jgi:predicted Rossmann fold nucleotide-binding protein DprA/Smf involved in DNA uptake
MTQRLFHVEMLVKETKLWDLLDVIEKTAGVGDLKVRHVTEAPKLSDNVDVSTTQLALPDVQPAPMYGENLIKVLHAMSDEPVSPRSLAGPTGLRPKQVAMALYILLQKKRVRRIAVGTYVRVTP